MTTIEKLIRKSEKKVIRKAMKHARKQLITEHNLEYVAETREIIPFKFTLGNGDQIWNSPFKTKLETKTPSLRELFFR